MIPPASDSQNTERERDARRDTANTVPIKDRLEKIGSHLRKNTVSANHGQDAGIKVADRVYKAYTEASKVQEDILTRATDEQRDVIESLSSAMIRFRSDEKGDTKKFQKDLLSVLQQSYATDGDEGVKSYVESEVTKAMHEAEKGHGVRGSIHNWMTKDAEKDKESWLFNALAGKDPVEKDMDIARNAGIAENEQNKLYDTISNHGTDRVSGGMSSDEDTLKRLENMIRDMISHLKDGKSYPDKIDVLNVGKLVADKVDRGDKPKVKKPKDTIVADELVTDGHRPSKFKKTKNTDIEDVDFTEVSPKPKKDDELVMDGHKPSTFKKTKNTDIEDVDFTEVSPKKAETHPLIEYKRPAEEPSAHPPMLALGYTPQEGPKPMIKPMELHPSANPIDPKYQGTEKSYDQLLKEAMAASDVSHVMPKRSSARAERVTVDGDVDYSNTKRSKFKKTKNTDVEDVDFKPVEPTHPQMNKFDAQLDESSTDVTVKPDAPADVTPAETSDGSSGIADMAGDLLPKAAKAARSILPKAGGLLKTAGKAAAVLAAGKSVYDGVSDEMSGHKVESASDIIPKGGLLDKLNPFEYAMNGGRYIGDKINKGYGAASSALGGSGDMGSDIYDLINPSTKTNKSGDELAKSSAEMKAQAAAKPAPAPVVVHAPPASASPSASSSPAPVVSGDARSRESYFDRQMMETFTAL